MVHIVWIVAAIMILMGIAIVINPKWLQEMLKFFVKGRLVYLPAALKIFIGILFLIYARECKLPAVVILFGIITLIGNLSVFLVPFRKIQGMMLWWQTRPVWVWRMWGVIAIMLGALLFHAGIPIQ